MCLTEVSFHVSLWVCVCPCVCVAQKGECGEGAEWRKTFESLSKRIDMWRLAGNDGGKGKLIQRIE